MAAGRKRKTGKRYPCGKRTRQETERDAMSTVIEARRRHFGVTAKQAKDERLGTGTRASRILGTDQRPAIPGWCSVCRSLPEAQRHDRTADAQPDFGLLINEGIFGANLSEPGLEVIEKLKRRFAEATAALDACDREQRMSAEAAGRPCSSIA